MRSVTHVGARNHNLIENVTYEPSCSYDGLCFPFAWVGLGIYDEADALAGKWRGLSHMGCLRC